MFCNPEVTRPAETNVTCLSVRRRAITGKEAVQSRARGATTSLKPKNKDGRERLIKP